MKFKRIYLVLIFMCFLFISCIDTNYKFINYEAQQKANFETTFNTTFGEIQSDHTWGFDSVTVFDYTTKFLTRGHNVNRNEWQQKYIVPPNVTTEEELLVINELFKGNGNRDMKLPIDLTDFFVYQVHKGTDSYYDHNNNNIGVASNYMNHLQVVYRNGTMEHINDFNNGQHNSSWGNIIGATLMINSSTYNFVYHNSRDNKYHDTYTIIDGNNIGYPGFYYICFDFLANGDIEQPANKNMGVDRNYNYTDWIIRISPVEYNMDGAIRIIAEDLSSARSDFDYNDVVFDVKIANEWVSELNSNKLVGYFKLQAAGGTLPLLIVNNEVHTLFNVRYDEMINTGIISKQPVYFKTILGDADWSTPGSIIIKNIPVIVRTKFGLIELETETGNAPEKIAVRTDFQWCDERIPIQTVYPKFKDWVKDKSIQWVK